MDIAHLKRARDGYDTLYKSEVWDVSQNVDRFQSKLGVGPAVTPGGIVFVTNMQRALLGSELLALHGISPSRLFIGNETQRDLQDLAGNAMSTPVICKPIK